MKVWKFGVADAQRSAEGRLLPTGRKKARKAQKGES